MLNGERLIGPIQLSGAVGGTRVNSLGGDVIVVASTMIERIVYGAQGMHGGVQSSWHRGI